MKKNKWTILSILGVVIFVGIFFFSRNKSTNTEAIYGEIKKGAITIKILTTGTVQPENRLQIKSPIAGRVDRVLVSEGDKVRKGQILAWLSSTERAALIDAARSQGGEEVKKWESLYKPTPLVAPISGMIIQRSVETGQTFTTNDAVLVMSDRLTIKAQVDETDLAQIHLKQKAEVALDAYPNKVISAIVDQIAYEATTVNNVTTYSIDVLPDEELVNMRSGMTANVTFIGETKNDILVVPNEFIKYENGKPRVLVMKNNKTDNREVLLGLSDGKISEVLSGLELGDKIVLYIETKGKSSSGSPFSPMGARKSSSGTKK